MFTVGSLCGGDSRLDVVLAAMLARVCRTWASDTGAGCAARLPARSATGADPGREARRGLGPYRHPWCQGAGRPADPLRARRPRSGPATTLRGCWRRSPRGGRAALPAGSNGLLPASRCALAGPSSSASTGRRWSSTHRSGSAPSRRRSGCGSHATRPATPPPPRHPPRLVHRHRTAPHTPTDP